MAITLAGNTVVSDTIGPIRGIPVVNKTSGYTPGETDSGKCISITTGGVTIPARKFREGDWFSIYNNSSSDQTLTQGTSPSMKVTWAGTTFTGNRTLAQRGFVTVYYTSSNTALVTGNGIT